MKRFSAHYIFLGDGSAPLRNGVVEVDAKGVVTDIIRAERGEEVAHTQFLNGIITPGFVNAHCHLELSHMTPRGIDGNGLVTFVEKMVSGKGKYAEQEVVAGIMKADKAMLDNGIVAVGDVSNTAASLGIKRESKIYYHTFCEALGLKSSIAQDVFSRNAMLGKWFELSALPFTVVAHAPYTVSKELFALLFAQDFSVSSLHLAESATEREFYCTHSGAMWDLVERQLGKEVLSDFNPNKLSVVDFLIDLIPKRKSMLFVHNTDLRNEEYQRLTHHFDSNNKPYFCTCPKSNLIIEGRLPDYSIFTENMCIGTDSLASNNSLSILEEMKIIAQHVPTIELNILVEWACHNGAKALKVNDRFGSIAIGKTPGLNFIDGIDFDKMALTSKSTVKPLV
ncbi:MAG: amidohydrolase family protein [Bacteroidales bacterium]